jgi:hypothetical protein
MADMSCVIDESMLGSVWVDKNGRVREFNLS